MRLGLLALGAALVAAPAAAEFGGPAFSASYVCADARVVQAAYVNTGSGPGIAVIAWAGKLVPMRAAETASGARYIAFDEQESYRWATRGEEATLSFLAADHTAREEIVATGCRMVSSDWGAGVIPP